MNVILDIMEKLDKIETLEEEIKKLADNKFSKYKYYTDLLTLAVVDRSLKLSRGFSCLIEDKNVQCAMAIARCQIDNLARFHGIKLFEGRERTYVDNFLNPQKNLMLSKTTKGKSLLISIS